jgi:hypothetical protein
MKYSNYNNTIIGKKKSEILLALFSYKLFELTANLTEIYRQLKEKKIHLWCMFVSRFLFVI